VQIYLPIAEMPVSVLLILGMGAAVGFVSGLFGIGGGFLMTPLLIFLGIPPAIAVATQSAQIAASSTTGTLSALRRNAVDLKLGFVLVGGGFVGTSLGVWFFAAMRRAGQLDLVIVLSYVTLFTVVGSMMLLESLREFWSARRGVVRSRRRAGEHPAYLGLPLRMRFPRSKLYSSVIPILGIAVSVGFIGAVLGIGGAFIMVPVLLYLFRVPTAVVVGTSQLQVLCTALLAVVLQASLNGAVDVILALILVLGGVFGAQFGARDRTRRQAERAVLHLGPGRTPMSRVLLWFVATLGSMLGAGTASAERLVLSLSTNLVAIGSNYTGARLVAFGVIERDGQSVARAGPLDIAVTVRGPREAITVRQKEALGPIWLNRSQRKFFQAPSFLAVFSSRPVEVLAAEPMRRRLRLGLDAIVNAPEFTADRGGDESAFRRALIRLKSRDGLYVENGGGVSFVTDEVFRAPIPLPATAPIGNYDVEVTLMSDGVMLARREVSFEVVKTGLEEQITELARDRPLLSGLVTAAMSLLLGWIASVIFRRD
jgi:uncharacterized protein (TIGR02186 family)